jgi:hypothetical protein
MSTRVLALVEHPAPRAEPAGANRKTDMDSRQARPDQA